MLNQSNRELYRSLHGEYKNYARRLKNTLFDCCHGKDAVNESLYDVFAMLAEAQGAGRDFADVIPDPNAGIRETALCFPARAIHRNTAVILCLAASLVLLAGSAVAIGLSGDVWLSQPVPYYDAENNTVYWQPVAHAEEYRISVNGSEVGTTGETIFYLENDASEEFMTIQVTATADGRYRENSGFVYYRTTDGAPRIAEEMEIVALFNEETSAALTYPSNIYKSIRIQFTPDFNLCVQMYGDVLSLQEGDFYTDEPLWSPPIDISEYLFLSANTSYILTLDPYKEEAYETTVTGHIELVDLASFAASEEPILPEGMTLFAKDDSHCDPEHGLPCIEDIAPARQRAYTAEGFCFSKLNDFPASNILSELAWSDSYYPSTGRLWLVSNLSQQSRKFAAAERFTEIAVSGGMASLQVPPGYSTYRFTVDFTTRETEDTLPFLFLYLLFYADMDDDLQYFDENFGAFSFHSGNGVEYYSEFFGASNDPSERTDSTITVYNGNETQRRLSYETTKATVITQETLTAGTLTLQPGITFLYNQTDALVMTHTDESYSACEYPLLRPDLMDYVQDFHFMQYAYIFNPYDEPITLTLTAYYAQTA